MPRYMDFAPAKRQGATNTHPNARPSGHPGTVRATRTIRTTTTRSVNPQTARPANPQTGAVRPTVKTTSGTPTVSRPTASHRVVSNSTASRPAASRSAAPRPAQAVSGAQHRAVSPAVHSGAQAVAHPASRSAAHPDTRPAAKSGARPAAQSSTRQAARATKSRGTRLASRLRRPARSAEPIPDNLFDDENIITSIPANQPVSDFTDLEQLAEEIAEVTQTGPIVDSDDFSLGGAEDSFSLSPAPQFGVVENYQPKFVNTEVEKRPLSQDSDLPTSEVSITETPDSIFGSFEDLETGQSGVFSSTTDTFEDPATGTAGSITTSAAIASGQDALVSAKSTRIRAHRFFRPVEKPVENSARAARTAGAAGAAGAISGAAASAHAASTIGAAQAATSAAHAATSATTSAAHAATSAAHTASKVAPKSQMRIPQAQFINQNKVQKRPLSKNYYPENAESIKSAETDPSESVKIAPETKKSSKIGTFLAIVGTIILGAVVGTVAFLLLPR